jgi:hypothetical protein
MEIYKTRTDSYTLCVQEVANWNRVGILVHMNGSVSEHLLAMSLRSDAHVLLAKRLHMRGDVGMLLYPSSVIRIQLCPDILYREGLLTSCSDSGIF